MESEKLMPCPFCGGEAAVVDLGHRLYRPSCNHPYCVFCAACDLMFGYDSDYGGIFDTKKEATKEWNRRSADDHK